MFLNDIEHNWIGEIPVDWEVKRIKNVFYLKKGVSENPQDEQILSLTFGGIVKRDVSSNEGQLPETYNGYTKIYPDDIVMNPMDLRSGWIDRSKYDGIISPSYYVLNKNTDEVDIGYFNYQLQRHYKERIFFPFGQGVSYDYRWGMGRETILNFPIIVPPKETQTQIVSYLDTKTQKIDGLIEKTEQKIELLKEKRTSLINHCVTKGLNPNVEMKDSGVEWIGEIPNHWDRIKLGWISKKIGDGLHSTPKYVDSSDYYFINGNNLVSGKIKIFESTKSVSEEEYNKHFIQLDEKTILLSINGTIGNLSFYNNEKVVLGKSSCYINLNKDINQHFIYYVLRCKSIVNYFTFELTGTTIFNLSLNSVKNTPIVFPPNEEQTKIVEYLNEQTQKIDSTIEKENQRTELLKEYRQSLISEVVTGKVDVRNWVD
jgi:type I restriction enzyme, S subunit